MGLAERKNSGLTSTVLRPLSIDFYTILLVHKINKNLYIVILDYFKISVK